MDIFPRQNSSDGCIVCPAPGPCPTCKANEQCILINRDCTKCGETKCVAITGSTTTSSGGISKGALAGGIVAALLFFSIALALFLGYRKKLRMRKSRFRRSVKDKPAPAEMVLNRPDPMEKPPSELDTLKQSRLSPMNNPRLPSDLHPPLNPFDDVHSIQTAGTEGTNVIPIALVSPDSHHVSTPSESSSLPVRPVRTPDVNLNLEHLNVSHDNLRLGAGSTRSGVSGISRHSYMSSASYASEILNEAPKIMTPTQRQVLGVVKAEVINTATSDTLKSSTYGKPAIKSPLATNSFGMNQTLKEADESQTGDPFSDENMSTTTNYGVSPTPTTTSFGPVANDFRDSTGSTLAPELPGLPPRTWNERCRPSSMSTQAGSVIDIASATRVNLGLKSPGTGAPFRTTMGKLVSPSGGLGAMQEQQRRALAHAQAQVQGQGLDLRRVSGSSVVSATSTRADSILESFPFVPPSPISDRPVRSPPVSPLAKQSFTANSSQLNQHTVVVAPPTPRTHQSFAVESSESLLASNSQFPTENTLPAPPNRRTLGLSTGSNLSTASSGLGSFPFQIESEPSVLETPLPAYSDRKRASLDTLALTNDLSSYPLSFDRGNAQPTEK